MDRELHLVAVLKVKKTISGTMELHLPPSIVISVAAAAAILEDVHDEAPPPSRQGQESLEWQERTPTYLAGGELITCAVFRDLASHGARVFRRRFRVSSERFLRLVGETISQRRRKFDSFDRSAPTRFLCATS